MKTTFLFLMLLASINSFGRSDSSNVETNRLSIEAKVFTATSVVLITAGGIAFSNGDITNGLFLLTAGVILQITTIIIDLDRPKKVRKQ